MVIPLPHDERVSRDSGNTVAASVFERLLSAIVSGQWKPADRIPPERDLSQQLGVGRASLREALKALELIGMIESRVGDGTFVCGRSEFLSRPLLWAITGSSLVNVNEIVESRVVLEGETAAFAAQRATAEDLVSIEKHLELFDASRADADLLLEADLRFHLGIANAAHNQILFNAVQMIRNLMRQWMLVTLHVPGLAPKVSVQHRAIFEAVRSGDAQGSREAMYAHLKDMGSMLVRIRSASNSDRSA